MQAMEAERQLPPLIERALANSPEARRGWQLMPQGRRRGHLLGIFYYRNPESRGRRLETALREMIGYPEKPSPKYPEPPEGSLSYCDPPNHPLSAHTPATRTHSNI